MPTSHMEEFLSGLKSHDEERRVRTAYDLQRYVFTELREVRNFWFMCLLPLYVNNIIGFIFIILIKGNSQEVL